MNAIAQPIIAQPIENRIYGAQELKEIIKKHTIRGFIISVAILALLLISYFLISMMNKSAEIKTAPMVKISLSNLPPPPSVEAAPPPPKTDIAPPAARVGAPVAVPDAMVSPDMTFAPVDAPQAPATNVGENTSDFTVEAPVQVAQREEEPDSEVFQAVEKEPYIDLGELQKKVVYPEIALKAKIEGKVYIKVLVGKDGKPKKFLVEKSVNEILDKAASDAVMKSIFTPAIQNGNSIDCWVVIPVLFKIK